MKENIVQKKSYEFALEIIVLYKFLISEKKEYILSKQLLRSGTSIGANIEEAIGSHSKKDFLSKITIAYKESRETRYWIRLLKESDYINDLQFNNILLLLEEILKLIGAIQKTTKNNLSHS